MLRVLQGYLGKEGAAHASLFDACREPLCTSEKNATPQHLPAAERVCAAGLLTQWLKPHIQEGGRDPRVVARKNMVADGVPLRCNRTVSKKGGLQASMLYSNEKLRETKDARVANGLARLTKPQIATLSRQFNDECKNLPIDIQQEYIEQAKILKRGSADAQQQSDVSDDYNSDQRLHQTRSAPSHPQALR